MAARPCCWGAASHFFLGDVRLLRLQWAGLLLGLAGLALIFLKADGLDGLHLPSVALVLAGVLCYVASAVLTKRLPHDLPPLVQLTGSLCCAALCALLAPLLAQAPLRELPGGVALLALLYSVVMGSLLAMFCYFHLMKHVPAGTVALSTLLTPVLALLLGMVLNHERFRVNVLWGMGLIVLGLAAYYGQEFRRLLQRRPAPR